MPDVRRALPPGVSDLLGVPVMGDAVWQVAYDRQMRRYGAGQPDVQSMRATVRAA